MTDTANREERFSLSLFIPFLFLVSWPGTLPMILASHGVELSPPVKLLQILMLFGPVLAACFASWVNEGWNGVKRLLGKLLIWRVNIGWYFLALFVPPLVYAAALLFSNATGQTNIPFPIWQKFLFSFLLTLGTYLLLNTEEIAWRGYVLPRLQDRFGIIPATIVIGLIWTVFHLPLFWIKGGHPAGFSFALFTFMVLGITFLFSAAFNGAAGSVLIVHLLHQGINAAVEAIPVYPRAVDSILPMVFAAAMFLFIGVALLWKIKERAGFRPAPTDFSKKEISS